MPGESLSAVKDREGPSHSGSSVSLRSHWYEGSGTPDACTLRLASSPARTATGRGWRSTTGNEPCTVTAAASVNTLPNTLVSAHLHMPACCEVKLGMVSSGCWQSSRHTSSQNHWYVGGHECLQEIVATSIKHIKIKKR